MPPDNPPAPRGPVRILVSACLLGETVRYDGGHKLDPFLAGMLGPHVEWMPVCPEVECGLPVPREAMRLAGDPGSPSLVTVKTAIDHTDRMRAFIDRKLKGLVGAGLCGYICKQGSPSCGLDGVTVCGAGPGAPSHAGRGLFTQAFRARFPLVPVEEEGRLHDPLRRDLFIERAFTIQRNHA